MPNRRGIQYYCACVLALASFSDGAWAQSSEGSFPEDDESALAWPFESTSTPLAEDFPPTRWASAGAFVGVTYRPSGSSEITYRPGVAYGGYLRPEIASWMHVRLFYRQESIGVDVEPGGYDVEGIGLGLEFEQPNITLVNLGFRVEPTWVVHPRFRVHAIVGWSWLGFRVPMPTAPGYNEHEDGEDGIGGTRSAVQTEFTFGLGSSLDIIPNWLDVGLDVSYSLPAGQTGSVYEKPLQIVVDGEIAHLKPLPKFKNSMDLIFSIGLIL